MSKLARRVLSVCLSVLLICSFSVSAYAAETEGPNSLFLENPEEPTLDTSIDLGIYEQDNKDESDDAANTPNKRDEDALYALVKVLNNVFRTSSFGTYSKGQPVSIRIQSQITITERVPTPPLINQMDYPNDPYGNYGSIASHGCGIACLTMAASYLLDEELDVVDMAEQFGNYNTARGSYWILFEDSAETLGLNLQERTYNTDDVVAALQNGQIVIALQGPGLFTGGGHFILLTGITEDGKILVNDPNGHNWEKNYTMIKGFAQGFTQKQVFAAGGPYWIYAPKEVVLETLNDERATVEYKLVVE